MNAAPTTVELEWEGELRFRGRAGSHELRLDSDSATGPSPMETLALAIGSCMAIDIVHILERMRTPLTALRLSIRGTRADTQPRRFVRVEMDVEVEGDVPESNMRRAIDLSRDKYCSVWHTIRPDAELLVNTKHV